ncbi:MAG: hypothetical protein JRI46_00140 [Deltaproteobacteria bacterium]|nr:hypothetical protein [Deltaproteobacteria bacterium]
MPSAWVHATIDLIAYGRPYFDLHKEKDEPYKKLGRNHRKIRHEWYQAFGKKWTLDEPFSACLKDQISKIRSINGPNKAEKQMAYIDHDYIDRIWDTLSPPERKYREGFFAWILFNPRILKEWAGVGVLDSRIQRMIDSCEVWEYCPELKDEYERLCSYVKVVIENDGILQNMLERYGQKEYIPDFG